MKKQDIPLAVAIIIIGALFWIYMVSAMVFGAEIALDQAPESYTPYLKANSLFYYTYLGEAEITGYSSEVEQTDDTPFVTASGASVRNGFIACPRGMEFGDDVLIDGKVYSCQDVMSKKYPNRFDIWFATRQEALDYGIQIEEVYLVR